jgi:preprotein translocase subunit SecA
MAVFNALGVPENEEIHHKSLTNTIERAQKKIEGNNFGIRKNLMEYDKVNNDQREIIYAERARVLNGENMRDSIIKMINEVIEAEVDMFIRDDQHSDWDLAGFNQSLFEIIPIKLSMNKDDLDKLSKAEFTHALKEAAIKLYEAKEAEFPEPEHIRELERIVLLRVIDRKWMDHLDDLEQLKQGIGLMAYGQRDPAVEYKIQGFDMFAGMIHNIKIDTIKTLYHIQVEQKVEREEVAKVTGTNKDSDGVKKPKQRESEKVYPNDPCPCGSGKKYKNCCGRNA